MRRTNVNVPFICCNVFWIWVCSTLKSSSWWIARRLCNSIWCWPIRRRSSGSSPLFCNCLVHKIKILFPLSKIIIRIFTLLLLHEYVQFGRPPIYLDDIAGLYPVSKRSIAEPQTFFFFNISQCYWPVLIDEFLCYGAPQKHAAHIQI